MTTITQLAAQLRPYIQQVASEAVTGGGAPTPHEMSSEHHYGQLSDDQGPQFLLRDGTRSLQDDMLVESLKTIDGVDISEHAHAGAGEGGTISHNDLGGLADPADDHTQYASIEGVTHTRRAYEAGRLNLNVNANAGLSGGGLFTSDIDLAVDYGTGLTISVEVLIHDTGDFGDMHTNYAEHDQTETITGAWTFNQNIVMGNGYWIGEAGGAGLRIVFDNTSDILDLYGDLNVPDDAFVGIEGDVRLVFNSTPTPSAVELTGGSLSIATGNYIGMTGDSRFDFVSGTVTLSSADLVIDGDYDLTIKYDGTYYATLDVDNAGRLILDSVADTYRMQYDASYYTDFRIDSSGYLYINPIGNAIAIENDASNYFYVTVGASGDATLGTVGTGGNMILAPQGDDVLPQSSLDIDLGDYDQMWRSLYVAELYAPTIVAADIMATIGGRILVAPTTYLTEDLNSTQYIENGGFETAGTGGADVFGSWIENAGSGAIYRDTTPTPPEGTYLARLVYVTGEAEITQSDTLTGGETYSLTMWVRRSSLGSPQYRVENSTDAVDEIAKTGITCSNTDWTHFRVAFTVSNTGSKTIVLHLYSPSSGSLANAYFDDVQITEGGVISVEHNNLSQYDYIFLQASPGGTPQTEAMQVLSTVSGTGPYFYQVARALDGTSANNWYEGDAVVCTGYAAGEGWLDLTSTSTILTHDGPTVTVYARTGTAEWNDANPVVTMGNLDSFLGYGLEYGFAAADDLTVDPAGGTISAVALDRTNGLRLWNSKVSLYSSGVETISIDPSTPDISIGAAASTMDYTTGVGFWAGNDSGTYKWRVGDPSNEYMVWDGADLFLYSSTNHYLKITSSEIGFYADGDLMLYIDDTPELVMGNAFLDENYLVVDAAGIYIYNSTDAENIGSWVGHAVTIGSVNESHISIDDTNGIRLYGSEATPEVHGRILVDGSWWFGASYNTERISWDTTNGFRIFNASNTAVVKFPTSGDAQVIGTLELTSPGKLYFGGGAGYLTSTGVGLTYGNTTSKSIMWYASEETGPLARIYTIFEGTSDPVLCIQAPGEIDGSYDPGTVRLLGYSGTNETYLEVAGANGVTVGGDTGLGILRVQDTMYIGSGNTTRYFHYASSRTKYYDGGDVAEFTTYGMYLPRASQTYNLYLQGNLKVAHGAAGHIDLGATTNRVQSTTPYLNFTSTTVSEGGRICNAFAGNWTSGSYAHFCHWNYYNSGTGYGFMQNSTGLLYLSTASNQYGYLRVGNVTIAQWDNSGFRIEQNYEYMAHRYNSSGTSTWYTTYTFVPLTSPNTVWSGITRSSTSSATIIYWNTYGVPRDAVAVYVMLDVVSSTAGDRLCFTPQNNITTACLQARVQVASQYSPAAGIVPTASHGSTNCYSYWWTGGTGITAYCQVWGYFM